MNVLFVGNLYPPYVFGGYEILCAQAAAELRRRGHRVRVLTSAYGLDQGLPEVEPGVERSLALTTMFPRPGENVTTVDFRLASLHRVARGYRALTARCLDRMRDGGGVDLLFCWCLNRLGLGALFAARDRGVPACYTVNDEHPKQYRVTGRVRGLRDLARAAAERWVWPLATLRRLPPFPVTLISEALKRRLLDQGVPFDHARVIYQGIELENLPFRPGVRGPGEPLRIVYAGQLSRAKGVHTLVRAVGRLAGGGGAPVRLSVAGSGVPAYVDELRALAAEAGIAAEVDFLGMVPHEGIAALYHRHHVLVFPSEWEEPFGLTHLEAMACGLAVVSTTTGGSAELIRDGRNALAFRAGDPEDLARALDRLRADEGARQALAAAGRRHVEEHHSFSGYVDQLEEFMKGAVAEPPWLRPGSGRPSSGTARSRRR